MAKTLCFSVDEWLYNTYFTAIKGNKSAFIRNMFIRGIEAESGNLGDIQIKYANVIKTLNEKDEEIRKIKAELGRLKTKDAITDYSTNFTDQDLLEFKQRLDEQKRLKDWFIKCIDIVSKDPTFREGRYNLFKNEIERVSFSTFNFMLNLAIELRKRGEL
jgi:hypothetical protein